ncbi:MAG: hypothetical protein ABI380_03605 [Edaphobacter sp.]
MQLHFHRPVRIVAAAAGLSIALLGIASIALAQETAPLQSNDAGSLAILTPHVDSHMVSPENPTALG